MSSLPELSKNKSISIFNGATYDYSSCTVMKGRRSSHLPNLISTTFEMFLRHPGVLINYEILFQVGGSKVEDRLSFDDKQTVLLRISRLRNLLGEVDINLAKNLQTIRGDGFSWG